MLDFVRFVATESDLFNSALQRIWEGRDEPSSVAVPSCPDWSTPDLAWHLTEVQYFWASIVEGSLADPSEVTPLTRPEDDQLPALHAAQAERLTSILADADPQQPCWSWDGGRQDVAWVRRRQAHEALIHRIDAEQAANGGTGGHTPVDEDLAADGVDEMLRVMLDVGDELPEWGTFDSDGSVMELQVPGRAWSLKLGALVGTDSSGTDQHLPAIQLLDRVDGDAAPAPTVTTSISCSASVLDLWLWRRDQLTGATVHGDELAAERLYQIADFG